MEGGLPVDVGPVNVALVVVEKRNNVVDVAVRYRMEHDVVANLLDFANHLNYNSAINSQPASPAPLIISAKVPAFCLWNR